MHCCGCQVCKAVELRRPAGHIQSDRRRCIDDGDQAHQHLAKGLIGQLPFWTKVKVAILQDSLHIVVHLGVPFGAQHLHSGASVCTRWVSEAAVRFWPLLHCQNTSACLWCMLCLAAVECQQRATEPGGHLLHHGCRRLLAHQTLGPLARLPAAHSAWRPHGARLPLRPQAGDPEPATLPVLSSSLASAAPGLSPKE